MTIRFRSARTVLWLAFAALAAISAAFAQQSLMQGDAPTNGHVPTYATRGYGQPILRDGGDAGGASVAGKNPGEIGITAISPTNSYPSGSSGHGPNGEHFCIYDAPVSNATGYHYLCLDPNAQGGGLLSYGAGGGASALQLNFLVNGLLQSFPFNGGTTGGGSVVNPIITASASTTVSTNASNFVALTGSAVQTVTLPSASAQSLVVTIKDGGCNSSTYAKTILPSGSDTIDGYSASAGGVGLYTNCASVDLVPTSQGWFIR